MFFARPAIENRTQPQSGELARHFTVALRRPALRAPACSRTQNGKVTDALLRQALPDALLRPRIARQVAGNIRLTLCRRTAEQRLGQRKILLDDMPAARRCLPRIP